MLLIWMNWFSIIIFYLFLFIYLAVYCDDRMTSTPSILLSFLIFFPTVTLALIGKYFTFLIVKQ